MDQNSEAVNRAISQTLKKVDRNRRMRGVTALTLGISLAVFSYLPAFFKALAGNPQPEYSRIIAFLSLICTVYGIALFAFGMKVRIFYFKYFGPSRAARILFYALYLGLIFLLDMLARIILVFASQQ